MRSPIHAEIFARLQEFGVQNRPYRERVLQIINEVRREEGLPLVPQR
jgi:hypothetical protein